MKFLRAVIDSGEDGITANSLARRLGLADGKSTGAIVMILRKKLKKLKIKPEQVISKKRHENKRLWFPEERGSEVLGVLEKQ